MKKYLFVILLVGVCFGQNNNSDVVILTDGSKYTGIITKMDSNINTCTILLEDKTTIELRYDMIESIKTDNKYYLDELKNIKKSNSVNAGLNILGDAVDIYLTAKEKLQWVVLIGAVIYYSYILIIS
tara:strand:+ start:228 stop:608 length:381 start_codon:yes stop_codon:yes gene_type:complete